MRNTLQYPVTKEEKLRAIDEAIEYFLTDGGIGDIRPLALKEVRKMVEASEDASEIVSG